jgi:hypothetical protein
MTDSTTPTPSGDADSQELAKLEQAVKADQAETESVASEDTQTENAPESPFGEAFAQIADKKGFKSVDDLVRAYENAESFNTKLAQEMQGVKEEIRKVATPQPQPQDNLPPEQKQALDMLRGLIREELSGSLEPLKNDFETRRAQESIDKVKQTYNVSDDDVEQALAIMQQNKSLALEDAVKIATYEQRAQQANLQQGRTAKTQQAKRAFVETAKTSKSSGDTDYSKLSLEELERLIPKDGDYIDSKGVMRQG